MMKYNILILTDNNRRILEFRLTDREITDEPAAGSWPAGCNRLIYHETFTTLQAAQARLGELQAYTRMQTERLIRRTNPNWVGLLRPSLRSPFRESGYQPGVKFNPKVPNLTSER